eukprot:scaffold3767_cov114-Isochrysis_galbana.AAC.30
MQLRAYLLLAAAPITAAWMPAGAMLPKQGTGRASGVRAQFSQDEKPASPKINPLWNEPILDDFLPDPVFDDTYEYKGRSKTGFVTFAEKLNGRASMMGFTILFLQELITGKGVLELYGLPCAQCPQLFTTLHPAAVPSVYTIAAHPAFLRPRFLPLQMTLVPSWGDCVGGICIAFRTVRRAARAAFTCGLQPTESSAC